MLAVGFPYNIKLRKARAVVIWWRLNQTELNSEYCLFSLRRHVTETWTSLKVPTTCFASFTPLCYTELFLLFSLNY